MDKGFLKNPTDGSKKLIKLKDICNLTIQNFKESLKDISRNELKDEIIYSINMLNMMIE